MIRSSRLIDSFKDLNWLGDSNFPQTASHLHPKIASSMFEDIFTQYSRLHITVLQDRPIAVQGLESRLAKFYDTQSAYGILKSFLHRSLLWQCAGNEPLQPIVFKGKLVPSWSWMAYFGAIQYGAQRDWHTNTKIQWNRHLKLDAKNRYITAQFAGTLQNFHIQRDGTHPNWMLKDSDDALVGWMKLDQDAQRQPGSIGCVIVGKNQFGWRQFAGVAWSMAVSKKSEPWSRDWFCYALLVDLDAVKNGIRKAFLRLGVAVIRKDLLLEERERRTIHLI